MTPADIQGLLTAITSLSLFLAFCMWVCVGTVYNVVLRPLLYRIFPDKPNRIKYLKPNGDSEYLYYTLGGYTTLEQRNQMRSQRLAKGTSR